LLVPLFATLGTLLAIVDCDVRRLSLSTARGHLPASLGWAKHDRLVASGLLGGDVAQRLKCVPEKVAMLTQERAPCVELGLRTCAPLASLAVGLSLDVPALPPERGP
jgi:hypothetical protein